MNNNNDRVRRANELLSEVTRTTRTNDSAMTEATALLILSIEDFNKTSSRLTWVAIAVAVAIGIPAFANIFRQLAC